MKIKFYGHSCFSISEGDITIITDPYGENSGKKLADLEANIVTSSSNKHDHNNYYDIKSDPKVFNWPGEYETLDVHMRGISSFYNNKEDEEQDENVIFKIEFKDIGICHLGSLGTKLTTKQIDLIGGVDILFVGVGYTNKMNTKKVKELIEQIEPRIIIPMAYKSENFNNDLAPLSQFLTEMGANNIEELEVFNLKRSELPEDSSKIVVLKELS